MRPSDVHTILIVEEESLIGWSMANALERAGYATEMVDSGEEALQRIRGRAYDLVLSDVRLSGMDGPDLAAGIRKISGRIPVVLIGTGDELGAGAIDSTCVDYFIEKPFNLNEIVALVGTMLKSTAPKMIKPDRPKTRSVE